MSLLLCKTADWTDMCTGNCLCLQNMWASGLCPTQALPPQSLTAWQMHVTLQLGTKAVPTIKHHSSRLQWWLKRVCHCTDVQKKQREVVLVLRGQIDFPVLEAGHSTRKSRRILGDHINNLPFFKAFYLLHFAAMLKDRLTMRSQMRKTSPPRSYWWRISDFF